MDAKHPASRGTSPFSPAIIGPALALASFSGMALLFGSTRKSKYTPPIFRSRKSKRDKGVRKALQSAQEALDSARQQIDLSGAQAAREDMVRRVGTLVETGKTNIPPLTQDAAEIARELAGRIRTEGAARGGEFSARLKTEVAPAARVWAQDALAEAEEILASAKMRAGEFSTTARSDYAPTISAKTGAAAGLVAGTAASVAQNLGGRASAMTTTARPKKGRRLRKQQTSRTGRALKQAGSSAKSATVETFLIFFWAAALGTAIYYALLTPDQRMRLRAFLSGAAAQMQDIVADFQGDADPFAASAGDHNRA